MKKRVLSMLLVVAMLLTVLPMGVFAADTSADAPEAGNVYCWVNPAYAGLVTPTASSLNVASLENANASVKKTGTANAAAYIRKQFVNRSSGFEMTIALDTYYSADDFGNDYVPNTVLPVVFKDTGKVYEGDYLKYNCIQIYWGWASPSYNSSTGKWEYLLGFGDALGDGYDVIYPDTKAQEAQLAKKIPSVLSSLGIRSSTPAYTKIKLIYDYICNNVYYDYDKLYACEVMGDTYYPEIYGAYAAMFDHTCVCQGYANLLYRMLETAGVDAAIISGGNHAWNIVKYKSKWYWCDTTWDSETSTHNDWYMIGGKSLADHTPEGYTSSYWAKHPMASSNVKPPYADAESESNNSKAKADVLKAGYAISGSINSSSDVDWYKVKINNSGTYKLNFQHFVGTNTGSSYVYTVKIYTASGKQLGSKKVKLTGSNVNITGLSLKSGSTYYIKIAKASSYDTDPYTVSLKKAA